MKRFKSNFISTWIWVFQRPLWCLLKCIADKPSKHIIFWFSTINFLKNKCLWYFSDNKMDPNEKVYLVKVGLNFFGIIHYIFEKLKKTQNSKMFVFEKNLFDFTSSKLYNQTFIALLKKSNAPFQTEQKIIKQKMRMKQVSITHPLGNLNMNLTIKTLDRKKIMICQFIKWF